jgi:hypothetical protein
MTLPRRRRQKPVPGEIYGLMTFGRWLDEWRLLIVVGEGGDRHEEGCGWGRLVLVLVEEAGRLRTKKRGLCVDTFVEQHRRRRRRLEGSRVR